MKIVVYGDNKRTGILLEDTIIDIAKVMTKKNKTGATNLARLENIIYGGQGIIDQIQTTIENLGEVGDELFIAADKTILHAPNIPSARIACAGGNYAEHAVAMAKLRIERGESSPIKGDPRDYVRDRGFWGFWKVGREAIGHNAVLPFPTRATYLDYEGEVAIVLGKTGKNIQEKQINDYIWGVTLLGDWSIRMSPEGGPMNFAMQKNFDKSCSIGPCILVGEINCMEIGLETRVNNEVRQQFQSGEMAFSYGEYLEYLSRDFTLYPGDIISGGTGAGTAADSSKIGDNGKPLLDRFLKPGDVVDIISPQIGLLRTEIAVSEE
ncbi:MAG: hypothetical protein CMM53_11255 [Rhodospirillaceae bacterium]|nr:hypothetical protein [Rhodospirillaceae bacterium]